MTSWIIPCNINQFNVIEAFNQKSIINWKQSTNINPDDIVYIYLSQPIGAIKFKTIATKVNLANIEHDDSSFVIDGTNFTSYGRYMELKFIEKYDKNIYPLERLKIYNIHTIQGPRRIGQTIRQTHFPD